MCDCVTCYRLCLLVSFFGMVPSLHPTLHLLYIRNLWCGVTTYIYFITGFSSHLHTHVIFFICELHLSGPNVAIASDSGYELDKPIGCHTSTTFHESKQQRNQYANSNI